MKLVLRLWCINSTNTHVNQLLHPFISNLEIYGRNKQIVIHSEYPCTKCTQTNNAKQRNYAHRLYIPMRIRYRHGVILALKTQAKNNTEMPPNYNKTFTRKSKQYLDSSAHNTNSCSLCRKIRPIVTIHLNASTSNQPEPHSADDWENQTF